MPSLHLAYDEHGDRTMPKFPFSYDLRTEIVRYRTFFGRRRVVVASTILFNPELYKIFKIVET